MSLPTIGPGCPHLTRPPSAVRTLYQHEHAVEALLRARNDRARSTGKEPARIRLQPELDGNRQLDRLTVKHARPGQGAPTGPIYLARDNRHNADHLTTPGRPVSRANVL